MALDFIVPDWPAPAGVKALQTTRLGGASRGAFASLNLGDHVGDAERDVQANRRLVTQHLGGEPMWLDQVHGTTVVEAAPGNVGARADASVSRVPGVTCAVMTADCLPVLLCDRAGEVVAVVHAGWRSLCGGVVERTAAAMRVAATDILAWLGPAIGPAAFEVGDEVRAAFLAHDPEAALAFVSNGNGKWLADIFMLARQRLGAAGVTQIHGGGRCTMSEPELFFSYRRDGVTGRMGSFIWLEA